MAFENMTVDEAIQYCYKWEKEYVYENDQLLFECLVDNVESGLTKPSELPDYGMEYTRGLI